ncbi:MAG: hypothetical protein KAW40_00210 [Candidatus Aenigmarchaeota archaeon]|nr:hypothetical protein [Candidatus Aenigmarchaeota archaeon]
MNWFATVIFAILEVALRSLANAYKFVGNSRQIGSTLADLGEMKTSRARPCLAVALSILSLVCLTSLVTTVSAAPADPGHPASSISAGTFEAGNFTFPDNLTIADYLIVDTDTLYVDALNNRVGIGTASPTTNLNIKGTLNTALTGTVNTSDTTTVANTSDDLTSEISVGDAIKIVNASDSSDFEIFTVNAITSINLTLDSTPSDNWTDALGYKDSDLFRIDDGDGTGKLIVDKTGYVGIGTTNPSDPLHVYANTGTLAKFERHTSADGFVTISLDDTDPQLNFNQGGGIVWGIGLDDGDADKFKISTGTINAGTSTLTIDRNGNVGIGTTGPSYLLEVAEGTEDAVNLSGVLYVNDTSNNVGIGLTDPGEKLEVSGNINVTGGNDICIGGGGKCLSTTGTGDGDLTDVLAGYGIAVDNSAGPSPRVNLSSSSAGSGLDYSAGVLNVGDGEGVTVAADSVGFDCSEVTDSASDGMRCSDENLVAGAGDGLSANNTDLEINEGEGVGILADILHFDCSEVTDTANDGVTCSTEDLVIGAGNGLTANATGLEIDLYTGSGLIVDSTGLSMNRSCSNGEILKWVASGSYWNCTEDSGLGSESDTLQDVTGRGNTTTQPVTIDSDSDELTNIANTLYVNGSVDMVGIGTASPNQKLDVAGTTETTYLHMDSTSGFVYAGGNSANYKIGWDSGNTIIRGQGYVAFDTDNGEQMRITSSGEVGIGTTSPQQSLHVNGSTVINGTLNMDSNKIISLGNGTAAQDAVTLSQLQAVNVSATAPETDPLWTGNWTNVAFTNIDETFDGNLVVTKNFTVDTTTLFVDSNTNNVGIGTDSPDSELHVHLNNVAGPTLTISSRESTSQDKLTVQATDTETKFIHNESSVDAALGHGEISFQTNAAEGTNPTYGGFTFKGPTNTFLRILNDGNVGINTTNPNYALVVQGVIGGKDPDGTDRFYMNPAATGVDMWLGNIRFDSRTNADSYFNSGGDVGIGVTTPEARLEVLASSGPQLMLTHTEATDYANFTVDSDGNLTILSSSGNVIIQLG